MDLSSFQIDIKKLLPMIVKFIEKEYKIQLCIDSYILIDIENRFLKTLARYEIEKPSLAKIASSIGFWIRKLKPISYKTADNIIYYHYVNELAALLFAISVFYNTNNKNARIKTLLPRLKQDRIFQDLLTSYRYNSHSPHSSAILFEVIFGTTALKNLKRTENVK